MKIILAPNGSARREVELSEVKVLDLWHLALMVGSEEWENIEPEEAQNAILEVWHLAYDLLWNLKQAEPVLEWVARERDAKDEDPLSGPEGD